MWCHCAAERANESESYRVNPKVLKKQHHPEIRLCTHIHTKEEPSRRVWVIVTSEQHCSPHYKRVGTKGVSILLLTLRDKGSTAMCTSGIVLEREKCQRTPFACMSLCRPVPMEIKRKASSGSPF